MKLLPILTLAGALLVPSSLHATDPKADLKAAIENVNKALRSGRETPQALAPELKAFDELLEKHKEGTADDLAEIMFMKAVVHIEVFEDFSTAAKMVKQLKKKYPDTKRGKDADRIIGVLENRAESVKIQASLKEGKVFPDFEGKDMDGQPLSVGKFKGKVVLVDFWATWCGPCVGEIPNMTKAYEKYHDKGFEIIGISLDRDRNQLDRFLQERKLKWPQHFDEEGMLATRYGINAIPATYLIGKDGKILATNLRGPALEAAVSKALAD